MHSLLFISLSLTSSWSFNLRQLWGSIRASICTYNWRLIVLLQQHCSTTKENFPSICVQLFTYIHHTRYQDNHVHMIIMITCMIILHDSKSESDELDRMRIFTQASDTFNTNVSSDRKSGNRRFEYNCHTMLTSHVTVHSSTQCCHTSTVVTGFLLVPVTLLHDGDFLDNFLKIWLHRNLFNGHNLPSLFIMCFEHTSIRPADTQI